MTFGTILQYLLLLLEFEYYYFFVTFFFWRVSKPEIMLPKPKQVRKQAKKKKTDAKVNQVWICIVSQGTLTQVSQVLQSAGKKFGRPTGETQCHRPSALRVDVITNHASIRRTFPSKTELAYILPHSEDNACLTNVCTVKVSASSLAKPGLVMDLAGM
jgi:hypothetical protein